MKEIFDFRLFEERAAQVLADDIGTRLSSLTRKVVTSPGDEFFAAVERAHLELLDSGSSLIAGWNVHRRYSDSELHAAQLLRIQPTKSFGPTGEECGTTYDESMACSACGVGRRQTTGLRLRSRRIPKGDLADTMARETIASDRVVELCERNDIAGVRFADVFECGSDSTTIRGWRQIHVVSQPVDVTSPSRWGTTPFDDHGSAPCPVGHLRGLNLLSEAHIAASSWSGHDVVVSRQYEGRSAGVLRPTPIVLISQRAYRLLRAADVTGWYAEVAHLA